MQQFKGIKYRISELRTDRNMSQEAFAKFLGISRQSIGFYESGKRVPDASTIALMCEKCNVSADWILGLSVAKTVEKNIKELCDNLGLSEASAQKLFNLSRRSDDVPFATRKIDALDHLMCQPEFESFLESISACMDFGSRMTMLESIMFGINSDVLNGFERLIDYEKQVQQDILGKLESTTEKSDLRKLYFSSKKELSLLEWLQQMNSRFFRSLVANKDNLVQDDRATQRSATAFKVQSLVSALAERFITDSENAQRSFLGEMQSPETKKEGSGRSGFNPEENK